MLRSPSLYWGVLLLTLTAVVTAQPIGNACNASSPSQQWVYDSTSGSLKSASQGGRCLAALQTPPGDGTGLASSPCDGSPSQAFDLLADGSNLIVARSRPVACINLAAYGTSPGTPAWLYGCKGAGYTCNGNCDWEWAGLALRNKESGLCLDDGYAPPMPPTCAAGAPAAGLPFCDPSLPNAARAADLTARLATELKLALFALPLPSVPFSKLINETLGLAAFYWDVTMIHGLSSTFFLAPLRNATCFPHSIAQGASWDVDLVARIAAAVAYEARVMHQLNFISSSGRAVQALMAEGGPLANSAHDPRWGRAMETYGEDPELVSAMGRAFTLALQNESAGFMQVASMSRHFLGFHGATDLPNSGEEWVTPQWLADQHLPAYRALMVDGNAEAVMCSCNTMRVGPGEGPGGGIPACVHPLLFDILRNRWNSSALVQADNEAIFPMWQDHHYFHSLQDAVVGALNAGVYAVDSGGGAEIVAALGAALGNGTITMAQVDAMVQRQFEMRLRVGEFDTDNPQNPFRGPYDAAQLDGAAHRALAREAVQKSATLLRNEAPPPGGKRLLPLAASPPASIAVVGPWADAGSTRGDYGCVTPSYFGNYAATTSATSTILAALREEYGAASNVTYALGTNPYAASSPTGIADAAALAGAAQLTVLALGLGCDIESEGRDRPSLYLPAPQDALLAAVSAAVRRGGGALLLVTVSANVIDLDAALADAWLQLFITGEETGHGFVDVVAGRVAPSGRLPLTGYANEYLDVAGPTADFNMVSLTTGVGRTYRFADRIPAGMVKLPFGYGLSYSTFAYGGLAVGAYAPGANAINVSFTVANEGAFSPAREVAQLYLRPPSVAGLITPTLQLRGFTVVTLAAGDAPTLVTLSLPFPAAFATTREDGSSAVTGGDYAVFVGGGQPVPGGSPNGNVLQGAVTLPPMAVGGAL